MNRAYRPTFIDLAGKKIGSWTVLEYIGRNYWRCLCACGRERSVQGQTLRRGDSLGCVRCGNVGKTRTHGRSKTRLYRIYLGMISRCQKPQNRTYGSYGGRGISVCDEWRDGLDSFWDWALASGYADTLTIERIDVNGDYTPANCTWIPWSDQWKNKRNTFFITINGVQRLGIDIARERGIKFGTLHARVQRGLSAEDAVNSPVQSRATK